ncbi:LysR family transcriptional regulator, partial [Rhizobium ruizarguesonis]
EEEKGRNEKKRKPEGRMKSAVHVSGGQEGFDEFVSAFLKTYPKIQGDLFVTNLFLELIADNIDLGIRFGEFKDSTIP